MLGHVKIREAPATPGPQTTSRGRAQGDSADKPELQGTRRRAIAAVDAGPRVTETGARALQTMGMTSDRAVAIEAAQGAPLARAEVVAAKCVSDRTPPPPIADPFVPRPQEMTVALTESPREKFVFIPEEDTSTVNFDFGADGQRTFKEAGV